MEHGATSKVREVLVHGEIVVEGLLPYSSNYTLLATVQHDHHLVRAVYKPCRGERPLWDFPHGTLYQREIAAYLISEALGFSFVPLTIMRDGPMGVGSLQLFIEHDLEAHLLTMQREESYQRDIQRLVAFDYLVNNADRKSSHGLKGTEGRLWAIDHGICFHHEWKLRTVLWDYIGHPFPPDVRKALQRFQARIKQSDEQVVQVQQLLLPVEWKALGSRLNAMLKTGLYPEPGSGMNIPWPPF